MTTNGPSRRYHLRALVGQGAFGEVYLAELDSGAGFRRKVALKMLSADVAKMREASRRIRDEARILGRLSHRHIVAVSDLVKLGDRWAVVMDYVPGADVEQVVDVLHRANAPFPSSAALEVGAAIASALDAVFKATDDDGRLLNVLHRDIKPSNVRISPDGEVKVLDFGVARVDMEEREAKTRAQGWIGTERYMSPERILLEGDTAAGDVYATAASVVEMLLLRPLGRTPVLEDRHHAFVDEALAEARPRLVGPPEVIEEALAWLQAGLAARPADRPAAGDLADALSRLARRLEDEPLQPFARRFMPIVVESLGAAPKPVTGILVEDSEAREGNEGGTPPLETGTDRTLLEFADGAPPVRRWWVPALGLGAVVAILAIVVVGLWTFTPGPGSEPPVPTLASIPAPVVAEPVPEPAPAPLELTPTAVAAASVAEAPPSSAPRPRPAPAVAPTPAPAVASGPPVERALVSLKDASSLVVTCGTVVANGTASVRLRNAPSGTCNVQASYLGNDYTARIALDRPREFHCTVSGGALACP